MSGGSPLSRGRAERAPWWQQAPRGAAQATEASGTSLVRERSALQGPGPPHPDRRAAEVTAPRDHSAGAPRARCRPPAQGRGAAAPCGAGAGASFLPGSRKSRGGPGSDQGRALRAAQLPRSRASPAAESRPAWRVTPRGWKVSPQRVPRARGSAPRSPSLQVSEGLQDGLWRQGWASPLGRQIAGKRSERPRLMQNRGRSTSTLGISFGQSSPTLNFLRRQRPETTGTALTCPPAPWALGEGLGSEPAPTLTSDGVSALPLAEDRGHRPSRDRTPALPSKARRCAGGPGGAGSRRRVSGTPGGTREGQGTFLTSPNGSEG